MREIPREPIRFVALAPGHFHAALVLQRHRPGVDPRVRVHAPDGDDLKRFQSQVEAFNARGDDPTSWRLDIRSGDDWLERFQRERPGNTAVIAGRNKPKIDLILAAIETGLNVLADKPWIIDAADFPKLERARIESERRGLVAWTMMTERHDTSNRIQLELVDTPEIFGGWTGDPALSLESVHCLKKTVAGSTLRRPSWWFDDSIAGESLADVGTHLVDLALAFVAPGRAVQLDEVGILEVNRWPLPVRKVSFLEITGLSNVPNSLSHAIDGEYLLYSGNNATTFTILGVPVRVTTRWELERPGGDWHEITARGHRSTIAATQDPCGVRTIALRPTQPNDLVDLGSAVRDWCRRSQFRFPGVDSTIGEDSIRVVIPAAIRRDHESLFATVLDEYIRHFQDPSGIPAWEWPNRLVLYSITTRAVDLARRSGCSRTSSAVP